MLCFGLSVAQAPNGTSGGNSSPTPNAGSPTPVQINMLECMNAFDIHAQGVLVCKNYPDLYVVLKFAEQIGRDECQKTFQGSKWNCSTFSILKSFNIVKKGTREENEFVKVFGYLLMQKHEENGE